MTVTCIDVYFQIIQYKANIVKYTHRYVNLICISSKSTSCDGPGFSFSRETIPHIIAHIYTPGYSIYGRIPDDSNNQPQKAVRSPGVAPPPVFLISLYCFVAFFSVSVSNFLRISLVSFGIIGVWHKSTHILAFLSCS